MAREKAHALEYQPDVLVAEAEAPKEAARLEDLHIWQMEKSRLPRRIARIWLLDGILAERSQGPECPSRSCAKMNQEVVMKKTRKIKAEALGISSHSHIKPPDRHSLSFQSDKLGFTDLPVKIG